MDIRTCQLFIRLAQTRHFGRTAQLTALSPSAVSRRIQRLEQTLGHRLVERDSRGVHLTPAGRRFEAYATNLLGEWQRLCADLGAGSENLTGTVSVFGSVTASYSMLARILPAVTELHPGVEVKLRTGDQADGVTRVTEGAEDSAIVARPDRLASRLDFVALTTTPLKLIGPRSPVPLARRIDRLLADDTAGSDAWWRLPLVLAERGLARERLLARFRSAGERPLIYAQVAGHEAVVSMVSLGLGVALVPELVVEHSPQRETVRTLPWIADVPPFELGLVTRSDRSADPPVRALREAAALAYPQSDPVTDDDPASAISLAPNSPAQANTEP